MNGVENSIFENCCNNKDGFCENYNQKNDMEIRPTRQQPSERSLLTRAHKTFIFLEHQSLIDCIQADREYIVSAGRDHEINIWDTTEEKHICRLSGHNAPVTGLSLFDSAQSPFEKIIISSSEDGSIRVWSLNKGEELQKIETGNVITCMGIINKSFAVTGNHKGKIEVHHIGSGNFYTTFHAHKDPVDALEVEGNYICSATFEAPSCLKVWDIQIEHTRCIYCFENLPEVEFCCMTIWGTTAILGASNQQKLFIVDFISDDKKSVDLKRSSGRVQRVKVLNEWILSCSLYKTDVLLDVHRIHNYEHFGTFNSNIQQVKAIAAMEFDSSFKIVIGGSALAMLSFDFILTEEETEICLNRFVVGNNRMNFNKELSHYTLKNVAQEEVYKETLSDSEDEMSLSNCHENMTNIEEMYNENIQNKNDEIKSIPRKIQTEISEYHENMCTPQLEIDKIDSESIQSDDDETHYIPPQLRKTKVLSVLKSTLDPHVSQNTDIKLPHTYNKTKIKKFFQSHEEPRAIIRKLEILLDENKKSEISENIMKNDEKNDDDDAMHMKDSLENELEEKLDDSETEETIEQENDKPQIQGNNTDDVENLQSNINDKESVTETLDSINNEISKKETIREEILEQIEKSSFYVKRNYSKKNKKCKQDKKKEPRKAKQRRCQIM